VFEKRGSTYTEAPPTCKVHARFYIALRCKRQMARRMIPLIPDLACAVRFADQPGAASDCNPVVNRFRYATDGKARATAAAPRVCHGFVVLRRRFYVG
jgi:hypothetical protein